MDMRSLERRQDPRTHTFIPIALLIDGQDEETPAHLLDLSATGAAILSTSSNAPELGEHLNMHFERPNNDGGSEDKHRIETGIVVNCSSPERGVRRVGVRFFKPPDISSGLFDPTELLSSHRKSKDQIGHTNRWQTARNFQTHPAGASKADLQDYPW